VSKPNKKEKHYVDFGDQQVLKADKAKHVSQVFTRVADSYDLMNDLMSFGMHRLWKRFFAQMTDIHPGDTVLDVASGTGDVARLLKKRVGDSGHVVMTDINEAMLRHGQNRLMDECGMINMACVVADAEDLPFPDQTFDCLTVAFGLRNMTDKSKALHSFYRVLKPMGKLLVLEFSKAHPGFSSLYDAFSSHIIPKLGQLVANDEASYHYLVESIRRHPDQKTLCALFEQAGFLDVDFINLFSGVVAVHWGYRCP
jgi:demethylmenaquinone methyltransferase / 2-methoxy-6-polyprenyl-1,4-benzoquinol methylase